MVGVGVTVTVTSAVFTHPFASVPVTVYVWVEVGDAVTDVPVAEDRVADGAQEYVNALLAVNTVFAPSQIVTSALAVTFGNAFTETITAVR